MAAWRRGAQLRLCGWLLGLAFAALAVASEDWESQLHALIESRGGEVRGLKVGRACPTCMRGVVATRDFKPGEIIMKIPFNATIRLEEPHGFTAEAARHLFRLMYTDPAFNATFKPFLDMHPGPDDVLAPSLWTDELLALLQSDDLKEMIEGERFMTETFFEGGQDAYDLPPLWEELPEASDLSVERFKWVTALLMSRGFGFYRDGEEEKLTLHAVPLLDLLNHSDEPNAWRWDEADQFIYSEAVTAIKKGEEVTHSYSSACQRPDMSLNFFGFVTTKQKPMLAAIDLPGWSPENPYATPPDDDSAHEGPAGEHVTQAELERLKAILASLPTTEQADMVALASRRVTGWRERAIYTFRVMRKRALRQAIKRLEEALSGEGGSSEGGAEGGSDGGSSGEAADAGEEEYDPDYRQCEL